MDRIIEPDTIQIKFSSLFPSLTLSSSSPNRRSLLEVAGVNVRVYKPIGDEKSSLIDPDERIKELSENKMREYMKSPYFIESEYAISADTMVLFEGELIGKAKDITSAKETLSKLSGRYHDVISGASLYVPKLGVITLSDRARVKFKDLSDDDIAWYLSTNDWLGAAGSYRLQRNGYSIVEEIDGDWTTVVGLPMRALITLKESLRSAQNQA